MSPVRTTERARRHAAAAATAAFGLLAAAAGQAAGLSATDLSTMPPNSGSHVYMLASPAGATLTVAQTGGATMTGSDLFGFEGLWLGSDGTGGQYSFGFSQALSSLSFEFIALTDVEGVAEELGRFSTSGAATYGFASADGSAIWNGSAIVPKQEDSSGRFSITASAPAGFSTFGFTHTQPEQLQGFIITAIDYEVAAVPEPAMAALLAMGLLALTLRRPRRQARIRA